MDSYNDPPFEFLNFREWWNEFEVHEKSIIQEMRAESKIRSSKKSYYTKKQRHFKYQKEYLQRNPSQKMAKNFRAKLWRLIKGQRHYSIVIWNIIGCSKDELVSHIESGFQEGMSWDNYGKWHIDHIKPCRSFDLTNKNEMLQCFNYRNLQPLWAADNLRKGGKGE